MTNYTYSDVADYLKLLATKHVDIAHTTDLPRFFASWDEAMEKKANIKQNLTKAIMIVDELDVRGVGSHNDNNHRERTIAVFVLKMCLKKDFPSIDTIANECEQIQSEIIGRIRNDQEDMSVNNIASQFITNGYTAERVGPLFDNWYGYMFEHRIQHNVDLEYNAAKWL